MKLTPFIRQIGRGLPGVRFVADSTGNFLVSNQLGNIIGTNAILIDLIRIYFNFFWNIHFSECKKYNEY